MPKPPKAFTAYLAAVDEASKSGNAGEHTHRPALKTLIESLGTGVVATNEPKRVAAGAPDFLVEIDAVPVGFIECKDTHVDVDAIEDGEQISRYREKLVPANLLVTNYHRFIWYLEGERRAAATLDKGSADDVAKILRSFLDVKLPAIGTPKDLSQRLARLAHLMRETIAVVLEEDTDGSMHEEFEAFKKILVPNMTVDQFTDMYAQTITYGLFAARCFHEGPETFTRWLAPKDLPKTNPFLRQMFEKAAGVNLDDRVAWIVDCVANVLASADMSAILQHFGQAKGNEDPVIHFYETFLAEYDPKLKEIRGVYYTPTPVVSYIVRSVDHLLRVGFNLEDGIADRSVFMLDPAAGTGTFLQGVVDLVKQRLIENGEGGIWDSYVRDHLLPRLFGFELLMAPYAVAHMKVGMALRESGYKFETNERLQVYLTNALEETIETSFGPLFASTIAKEAFAAGEVKTEHPIMVVLGNPPYSGHSANTANRKLKEYAYAYKQDEHGAVYPALAKPAQAKWLSDDYVKFIRFAESRIERTGHGILAFITNHAWLDNPTFFGMRKKLRETFDDIWILDLHGNSTKKEKAPDDGPDENVFDIQQGVAISIFVKYKDRRKARAPKVRHAHLWGSRQHKYEQLAALDVKSTNWTVLDPGPPAWEGGPAWLFVPASPRSLLEEFAGYWSIPKIFSELTSDPAPGILTTHDEFAISWSKADAIAKIEKFLATRDESAARGLFKLCTQKQWNYHDAKVALGGSDWKEKLIQIHYRPFDIRHTVYDSHVAVHRRERVSKHMIEGDNVALLTTRMAKGEPFNHALATKYANEIICLSPKTSTNAFCFPLWIETGKRSNLNPEFLAELPGKPQPEQVFAYIYAILHARSYRDRFAELLRMDWPRIPIPPSKSFFSKLEKLGQQLVDLHTWKTAPTKTRMASYPVAGSNEVERAPKWQDQKVWINATQHFDKVPRAAWDFLVGGHAPAQKWLKDRRGRKLTTDDVTHYRRMIAVLLDTSDVMDQIDAVIAAHGGWPIQA